MFEGVYTALITPFKDGKIDYNSLDRILEDQIKNGVSGVLPMGTTGESPTVSHDEHVEIVKHVVKTVNGRIKVIAGTGSNSTEEACFLSKSAEECGVDAVLLVNPYYNKPPQRALIDHFATISKSIAVPVMLYNIPGRTSINFLPESVAKLCEIAPNVKAMKAASGDINQMMRLKELLGERLAIMSGDDNLLLPVLAIGGTGLVSVLSNIIPKDLVNVVNLYQGGKVDAARDAFYKLLPLCRMMFVETNPIPVKAVMAKAGFCTPEIRKPLLELPADMAESVFDAFRNYGVSL